MIKSFEIKERNMSIVLFLSYRAFLPSKLVAYSFSHFASFTTIILSVLLSFHIQFMDFSLSFHTSVPNKHKYFFIMAKSRRSKDPIFQLRTRLSKAKQILNQLRSENDYDDLYDHFKNYKIPIPGISLCCNACHCSTCSRSAMYLPILCYHLNA